MKINCLLIHVPKFKNFYKPIGPHSYINYMPMGLIGLADYLDKNNFRCRVLHYGVECLLDNRFDIDQRIKKYNPDVIGLTLHWHPQTYDVMKICRRIRKSFPKSYIILGGFTASYFYKEILKDYQFIDAIIRGDGEVPLKELIDARSHQKGDLSKIPNLSWRDKEGPVIHNEATYVGDEKTISNICFSNYNLLDNYRAYIDYITYPGIVIKGVPPKLNFQLTSAGKKLFPLCFGRGCPLTCTWCGGSAKTQRKEISCRKKVAYRSYDAILNDIKLAMLYGYEGVYADFDPTPNDQSWYIGLFKKIRKAGLTKKLGWIHTATGLTSKQFVDEFARTFDPKFRIIDFSPESGNESVRRRNKGYFYSNKDLLKMVKYIRSKKINCEVFFTYGIPGETEETFQDSLKLRDEIIKQQGKIRCVRAWSIEIEPGSPWMVNPENYNIVCLRNNFKDFYHAHSDEQSSSFSGFGYYDPNFFKNPLNIFNPGKDFADRIQNLKCEQFCFSHPNVLKSTTPYWGKLYCRFLNASRPYMEHKYTRKILTKLYT